MGDHRPACLVFAAHMIVLERQARWAFVRMIAKELVLSIFDTLGNSTPTVHGVLIITRRDTGKEVLRTETEFPLSHVSRQLDEMTAAEFCARWNIYQFR